MTRDLLMVWFSSVAPHMQVTRHYSEFNQSGDFPLIASYQASWLMITTMFGWSQASGYHAEHARDDV